MAFWPSGLLAFWPSGLLAFWPSGLLAFWPSGRFFVTTLGGHMKNLACTLAVVLAAFSTSFSNTAGATTPVSNGTDTIHVGVAFGGGTIEGDSGVIFLYDVDIPPFDVGMPTYFPDLGKWSCWGSHCASNTIVFIDQMPQSGTAIAQIEYQFDVARQQYDFLLTGLIPALYQPVLERVVVQQYSNAWGGSGFGNYAGGEGFPNYFLPNNTSLDGRTWSWPVSASVINTPLEWGLTYITRSPFNTPAIPDPETYALLLAGLGLIGVVARRRRNAAHQ
jgi:hypothetical protein